MATVGYIVLLAQDSVSVSGRYVAVYIAMTGGYVAQPIILVWVTNNMGGHYKRSINAAMQIGFGNLGGKCPFLADGHCISGAALL